MKFFKKGELKLLWPFYLDSLISPMLFLISAFMVVYFRNFGLSLFQTSLLFAMIPLFMILFEIPTGAIADLYGRKFSVLIGTIILGITIISIFFLTNFYALLFAFAMIGIGNTFSSGAKEAWITDLIKKEKKDFLLGYFAKSSSMESFGLVLSGIIGALLVKQFGISVIWIVTGLSFLITFSFLIFAKEHFVKRKIKIKILLKILQNNLQLQ
jgi:MFS family permease